MTAKDISEIPLFVVQSLAPKEIHKLTEAQVQAFTLEQISVLPVQHFLMVQVLFLTPFQVNAIIAANKALQESYPLPFSVLIRVHIQNVSVPNMALLSPRQINLLAIADIKKINPEQFAVFTPEQIQAILPQQFAHLTPQQIRSLTPATDSGSYS